MAEPDEVVIGLLEKEWGAIQSLCSSLAVGEWILPTECPGWSVKDHLSHLVGTERSLLGDAPPAAPDPIPGHVHNPTGATNEAWVDARRSVPGPDVLGEFSEVTSRRVRDMRSWPSSRFDEMVPSPVGQVSYREFMRVRAMDCWVHEQDIRVATGRRGHRDGAVAENALGRLVSAMGFVVAKKAGAPEGATVRFEVVGDLPLRIQVAVRDGRGVVVADSQDIVPSVPTTVLRMDDEAFWRLACGRVEGESALSAGAVEITGDSQLARRVLDSMAFMI